MSLADTQFEYRTVAVGNREGTISGSGAARRSSSVTSSRRRQVALRWSKRRYSVRELARDFGGQFPVLARVAQGDSCAELNDLGLDVGQVIDGW